jgi:CTP:molybdopterin cytidylyltransferase MocA
MDLEPRSRNFTASSALLILAAGTGSRFGGERQKCLAPLHCGEGPLQRLLRQLTLSGCARSPWVVTGHDEDAVVEAVRAVLPAAEFVFNPAYADGSLLASLSVGLSCLEENQQLEGTWVLFGDSIYQPQALECLLLSRPTGLTIASQPRSGRDSTPIGLRFDPGHRCLNDLGPDLPTDQGILAPAVYWPRSQWPAVAEAARRGLRFQWQLLREQVARTPVQILPLPSGQVWDIDRPEDLAATRQRLLASTSSGYFRSNISKEERNRVTADHLRNNHFQKVCSSTTLAERERSVLLWLQQRPSPCPTPAVLGLRDHQLCLEHVAGIRLYDLLRLLRMISQEGGSEASSALSAGKTLLHRALIQLLQMQSDLKAWPLAAELPPYPLHTHLTQLITVLADVLGLPPLHNTESIELEALQRLWDTGDVLLPFRDATPKNIIVAVPALSPRLQSDPQRRLEAVRCWLTQDESESVRLVDVDFASVGNRTAPEDDLFSLLAHAGSLPWSRALLAELVPDEPFWPRAVARLVPGIDPDLLPDPERAARALLVRYLRFGGRKLLYRCFNPTAYGVRFRYDDPLHYFVTLPQALEGLDPGFAARFPRLFERLALLNRAVALLPAWQPIREQGDFYSEVCGGTVVYWQESPLETVVVGGGVAAWA